MLIRILQYIQGQIYSTLLTEALASILILIIKKKNRRKRTYQFQSQSYKNSRKTPGQ